MNRIGTLVVADTSPLNYLIRLGCADLLAELYGQVLIPPAVLRELAHAGTPGEVRLWIAHPPVWLEVAAPLRIDPTLPPKLGPGEREAISLAIEREAAVLLVDDARGRFEARARKLPVNGTLFIVLEGAVRGRLKFDLAITQLRAIEFRFSQQVEDDMREMYAKRTAQGKPRLP